METDCSEGESDTEGMCRLSTVCSDRCVFVCVGVGGGWMWERPVDACVWTRVQKYALNYSIYLQQQQQQQYTALLLFTATGTHSHLVPRTSACDPELRCSACPCLSIWRRGVQLNVVIECGVWLIACVCSEWVSLLWEAFTPSEAYQRFNILWRCLWFFFSKANRKCGPQHRIDLGFNLQQCSKIPLPMS